MSRKQVIERERRWAPWAIGGAALPLGLFVAALFARASVDLQTDGLFTSFFRAIEESSGAWQAGAILQGVALIVLTIPLTYLFLAAAARSERVVRPLVGFCVLGPLLVGLQVVLQATAQLDVAREFVAQEQGVGDIYSLARNRYEDSGLREVAGGLGAGGALALIFAMVYTCLWASRTGLVTRFYGTLGMALGASLLFPPLAEIALPALFGWFAYLALIVSGRLRRGRPPAWDAGEAVPWPRPGEEPVAATDAGDVIEADASEIPGVEESPHAARRERAKRRKRKRRHS